MILIIICSLVCGVLLTLLFQWLFIKRWFLHLPVLQPPWKDQYHKFSLPKELQDILRDPELKRKKESCVCLNLILQFLFHELKDTRPVRRWVMKRLNMEFAEMLQTTTGKLLDQITVRDFNLGAMSPVIKNVSIQNVVQKDNSYMEELSLLTDVVYKGGFQLAVDVDMVFGKSAYLSVKVSRLQGRARLQFSRLPFTHWSFSFVEDPVMDFEVESHFEGRPVPQITSLIVNQIRRSVRKKHTLPSYKIRYRPFFVKPQATPPPKDVFYQGVKLSVGTLSVTVLECNRLVKVSPDAYIYCTLAVDTLPWVELMSSRRKLWVAHDIEVNRTPSQNIGLSFKDEYILDRFEDLVVVDVVATSSPAAVAGIRKNDVVVSVCGTKVTNTKQAAKLIKQAGERFTVRVERSSLLKGLGSSHSSPEFKFEEDTLSFKDVEFDLATATGKDDSDDYINITLTSPDVTGPPGAPTPQPGSSSPARGAAPVAASASAPASGPAPGPTPTTTAPASTSASDSAAAPTPSGARPPAGVPEGRTAPEQTAGPGVGEEQAAGGPATAAPPRKGISGILSTSSGLFHRKRSAKANTAPAPASASVSASVAREPTELKAEYCKATDDGQAPKVTLTPPVPGNSVHESSRRGSQRDSGPTREKMKEGLTGSGLAAEEGTEDSAEVADSIDMKKTQFVKATQEPVFNEKFQFLIEDNQNFLNICVWCKIPEKLDKQNRVVKPEKDILIGHMSISLMDVALECMTTLQGNLQHTYKLTPAELKAGASRKVSSLATHSGFEERLCYGDITLEFRHTPQGGGGDGEPVDRPVDRQDYANINAMREENELSDDKLPESRIQSQATIKRPTPIEGAHDFILTHFQSATYCNFCQKKIWLKTAFQCQECSMVCHKKCVEKCHVQTLCKKEGFQFKLLPQSSTPKKSVDSRDGEDGAGSGADKAKPVGEGGSEKVPGADRTSHRASFLSKFRKEMGKGASDVTKDKGSKRTAPGAPSAESLDVAPGDRKRHLSSPQDRQAGSVSDGDGGVEEPTAPPGVAGEPLPRTRSSTSIDHLLRDKPPPIRSGRKPRPTGRGNRGNPAAADTSDSEDEAQMNLIRFHEKQRASNNADEMVVTAAKEMGKELYAHLSSEERREKLDQMISKLQIEIDQESENRAEISRLDRATRDTAKRAGLRARLEKSDEKIQSLALLMLHYCAGLQHCLDQQEMLRQLDAEDEFDDQPEEATEAASRDHGVEAGERPYPDDDELGSGGSELRAGQYLERDGEDDGAVAAAPDPADPEAAEIYIEDPNDVREILSVMGRDAGRTGPVVHWAAGGLDGDAMWEDCVDPGQELNLAQDADLSDEAEPGAMPIEGFPDNVSEEPSDIIGSGRSHGNAVEDQEARNGDSEGDGEPIDLDDVEDGDSDDVEEEEEEVKDDSMTSEDEDLSEDGLDDASPFTPSHRYQFVQRPPAVGGESEELDEDGHVSDGANAGDVIDSTSPDIPGHLDDVTPVATSGVSLPSAVTRTPDVGES